MGRQGGRLRCIAAAVIALAAMAPAVKPAHAADVPSDATVIRGGFSAAGGLSAAGPYAAMLVYDLPDAPPTSDLRESLQVAAALGAPRRLVLATREGGQWQHVEIARADRIDGPVCPKETVPGPILAWTQRQGTQWELCVYRDGKMKTVASAGQILRHPLQRPVRPSPAVRDARMPSCLGLLVRPSVSACGLPGNRSRPCGRIGSL